MLDRLRSLALILERMHALYERVLLILEHEKRALIQLDYENLYTAIREKDEVLSAIRSLDKDRLRIQDHFAIVMDQDSATVNLTFIAEAIMNDDEESAKLAHRLLALREKIGKTVEHLKERLNFNKTFIERSIENLQGIAENLSSSITGKPGRSSRESAVYTGKAKYQESKGHAGSILEKRL